MKDFCIHSERLKLRTIYATDVDAIFSYRSLPEVTRFQYWEPYTMENAIDFVSNCIQADMNKKGEWVGLAIEKDGQVIGDCAIRLNDKQVEVGCNISPVYQSKGYAKETLSSLFNYAFKNISIEEVIGITDSENAASIKLMESCGMIKLQDYENRLICKGILSIEHKYILTRNNWLENNKTT